MNLFRSVYRHSRFCGYSRWRSLLNAAQWHIDGRWRV